MKKRVFSHRERAQLDVKSRVKFLCGMKGVSVIRIIDYQRFAGQIQAARRTLRGNELQLFATAQVNRYEAVGLKREVLLFVLKNEFTLTLPDS